MIPKGDVTTRTAFEVMPFENSLIIVGLSGKEIRTLAEIGIYPKEKKTSSFIWNKNFHK